MAEKRPLVLLTLSFALGVYLGRALQIPPHAIAVILCATFLIALAPIVIRRNYSTLLLAPLFFSIGLLFIGQYVDRDVPAIASIVDNLSEEDPFHAVGTPIEGKVKEAQVDRLNRWRILLDVDSIHVNDTWIKARGNVLISANSAPAGIMRGDRLRMIARLQRPQNFGNPGEFDYALRLRDEGVFVIGKVKSALLMEKIEDGAGLLRRVDMIRKSIDASIDNGHYRSAGIMKALLTGSQASVPDDAQRAFKETGTSHVLSISGLHVATVALFFYFISLNGLKLSERALLTLNAKKTALLATIAPVVFYGLIAGFTLPTARAVLMALALIIATMLDRTKDTLNAVFLAALVLLATSAHVLWDISFQLTFSAVISIILFAPLIYEPIEKLLPGQKDQPLAKRILARVGKEGVLLLSVSIAASLGTYPIVALHFNSLALTGLFANMLVVPIAGFIAVPLLLLGAIAEALASTGGVFFTLADWACALMVRVAELFSALPFASIRVPTPTQIELLLFYLSLGALLLIVRKGRKYAPLTLVLPLLLVALVIYEGKDKNNDAMEITFISVGQGDSALIELPNNKTMLIDGGGAFGQFDTGERIVAPLLWRKRISKIDYMVLTHQQIDHMKGLEFVLKNFRVQEFWWNGEGSLDKFSSALASKGVAVKAVSRGHRANINGVEIEVLRPGPGASVAHKEPNEGSLVMMISYAGRRALFTGDIGALTERTLVSDEDLDADILKVAHHGSRRSSSKEFIEEVSPAFSVASVGRDNPFGFPHREVTERLSSSRAEFFRTDKDGAITIRIEKDGALGVRTGLTQEIGQDILGLGL